ncbi:MAG: hypothetical protein KUF77_15470 [Candidatus Thiodiazotropha sp. (ex Lucina aurantia)]|nr:hypothetical protein [Candidatus Thiodiazotropha sp. (ex Lucina pensylvanica)]MBV2099511.1 hypothetical protein [Candidatus Thiodiazotropha sp. (ex Codakia orbicularis)]MBV2104424.1 hypothetical protein [Candidatus Thiodiazotropha sp. (ex Lucina aurantia)]MBV2118794.1 hypothetical protein [Candidatus Thiodiazotropha sp. (ex Lucina aurantia)]
MSNEAIIKSVETGASLVFTSKEGDYFTVRYESPELSLSKRVWGYTDCELLVQLFEFMAANWKGWEGSEEWVSIEGEFALSGTSDKLGHVKLALSFQEHEGSETWSASTSLRLESSIMEGVAKQVRSFFGG